MHSVKHSTKPVTHAPCASCWHEMMQPQDWNAEDAYVEHAWELRAEQRRLLART